MLQKYGINHQVLNAKHHEREAEIVAQAGRKGMVTIATNMAGRGTDIILGGNPEFMAWADLKRMTDEDGRPLYPTRLEVPPHVWRDAVEKYEPEMTTEGRQVAEAGGLHIIGTERHESRRIDNQLRGRAGRQGDPGSSRFFLSLEDDLMRKFAGEWVAQCPATPRHARRRSDREQDGLLAASKAPRRRSRRGTSTSARTSSNTTRSWTSSASGSTRSASNCSKATRPRTPFST